MVVVVVVVETCATRGCATSSNRSSSRRSFTHTHTYINVHVCIGVLYYAALCFSVLRAVHLDLGEPFRIWRCSSSPPFFLIFFLFVCFLRQDERWLIVFVHFYLGEAAQLTYSSLFFFFLKMCRKGVRRKTACALKTTFFFYGLKNDQQEHKKSDRCARRTTPKRRREKKKRETEHGRALDMDTLSFAQMH